MRLSRLSTTFAALCVLSLPAGASTVTDLVTFTTSGFSTDIGSSVAPVDPVTGSFTITFDPTQTYTNDTADIQLDSLNISLDSALSFNYSPTTSGVFAPGELRVGGVFDGSDMVQYSPPTNDFWLYIKSFSTSPTLDSLGYSQTAVGSDNLFSTSTGTVQVSSVPLPAGLPLLVSALGVLGLGARARRAGAC